MTVVRVLTKNPSQNSKTPILTKLKKIYKKIKNSKCDNTKKKLRV